MFATCLFCNRSLGANEIIESFPVGRRLAFDADKGRLWVVCLGCHQWNLTPLEERWEAIETCERLFRGTRRRVSTDEIGLARLPEGLELIRIGLPLRPELAAWRYGPLLGRRRRRAIAMTAAAVVVGSGLVIGGVAAGVITSVPVVLWWNGRRLTQWVWRQRVVARIPAGPRGSLAVRGSGAARSYIGPGADGKGWQLIVNQDGEHTIDGPPALQAARHLLAGVNRFGGTARQVHDAVERLSLVEHPVDYFGYIAAEQQGLMGIPELPLAVRLALEMAAHDEFERRAMEGELHELAEAWRQAEEVAAIADDMFLPPSIDEFLRRHRRKD